MSIVAAAIVGGSLISGYSSSQASESASDASTQGAADAAQATIQSTQMQVEEMARQFDFQMEILQPQIEQQFRSQQAYTNLLGVGGGGGSGGGQSRGEYIRGSTLQDVQSKQREINTLRNQMSDPSISDEERRQLQGQINQVSTRPVTGGYRPGPGGSSRAGGNFIQDRSRQLEGRGYQGERGFFDQNLDATRMADIETYSGAVQNNLLAGTDAESDPYRNYVTDTSLLNEAGLEGNAVRQDIAGRQLQDGSAGTGVYGDVFNQSPGYTFQVEEMNRATDRIGSAGGPNIGGRAIVEAQRRAQGLADSEYYNWAQGRERDLVRRGDAERVDAGRLDQTAYNYQNLEQGEQQRGDQAYMNYFDRRTGDASRLDSAARNYDGLEAMDRQRQDQSYYNYLDAIGRSAGFGGGSAAQAVSASQSQGANVANAYGNQGNNLSNIFQTNANNQGNLALQQGAGMNNAIQGGISNWITYQNSLPAAA